MLEEDFDGESFAAEVNSILEDETDRLKNFQNLGDTDYTIESETFSNLYNRAAIDIELSYSNDISDQVLIMEFNFMTNCPDFDYEMFTLNNYDPSEAVEFMIELYDDFLEKVYSRDKNLLHKFSKEDLKYMLKKHPEDEFIRSVAGGKKFKLFDAFINENKNELPMLPFDKINESKEEKSDIGEDHPIMQGLVAYFNEELDIILDNARVDHDNEYEMDVNTKKDSVKVQITATASVSTGNDISKRISDLREIASGLEKLQDIMKDYPFLKAKIKNKFPKGSFIVFEAKLSDLMEIEKINNLIKSTTTSKKFKLFLNRNEEV